ncbi:apolipoprotein N-acyltransferase [Tessaracoccus bendigoensis DSM 12906]|uniref:Apolipoprotein N-acyltransferase n=1 Tax=Tessaracoccus bendigoensis DSM 12906 TaxID=1123357 RepID=A0A1M6GSD8_9ACTN|nr:apolipoprotein N-acyltransferase [Tessaracoccus bendigoensis]SHJ12827.1 apolipoprotein N-acyltransferase [Tessaracoccus bendigoensis DSM 12906]
MLTRPTLPPLLMLVLSVAAGLLLGLGQAPMGVWLATIVGVALLTWLMIGLRGRTAFGWGTLAGLALNTLTISWVSVLGVWVAVALVAFMALWWGLLGLIVSRLVTLRGWAFLVPAAWVAIEFGAGSVPFGGFPWLRLGHTTVDQPMSGFLSLVGVTGVSYLVALVGVLGLWAATTPTVRIKSIAGIVALFVVGGLANLLPQKQPEQSVTVAMVQPNVNRAEKGSSSYARSVTNNALSETIFATALARTQGEKVDFVLWPENATDVDPVNDAETRRLVELSAAIAEVPIFVGAVTDGPKPDTRQTSSIWWDPQTGPTATYHKRNLVPFGEYIPFREQLLPVLPILRQVGRDSVPGEGSGVVEVATGEYGHLRVGTIICFELAYDDTVYDLIRDGAEVIVSQSNTNTYVGTFEPHQQLVLNRVRAMETGREVLASTLNSYSAVIDTHGRIVEQAEELDAATLIATVPLRYNVNLSVRLNPTISWLAVAATLLALGATIVRKRPDPR